MKNILSSFKNLKYNKKNIFINIIFIFISFLFFIALYFTSIQLLIKNTTFFDEYYTKVNIEKQTGISVDDASKVIRTLIDYIEDKTDSLKINIKKYAANIDTFNEQEITHMKDVKIIYQSFVSFRNIVFIIYILLVIYFICKYNRYLLKNTLLSFSLLLIIGIICATVITINFSFFWNCFHHFLFDNNLWIFDYDTSIMVQVCPNDLFKSIIISAFIIFMLVSFILLFIIYILAKFKNNNFKKA